MKNADTNKVLLQSVMNIKEAAEYLGISTTTIKRWEKLGRIKSVRHPINNYRLYKVEDLQSLLDELFKV